MKSLLITSLVLISVVGLIESASTGLTTAKSSTLSTTVRTTTRTVSPSTTVRTTTRTVSPSTTVRTTTRSVPSTTTTRATTRPTISTTTVRTTTRSAIPTTTRSSTMRPSVTTARTVTPITTARTSTSQTTERTLTPVTTQRSTTWVPSNTKCYYCDYKYCPQPFSSSSIHVDTVYSSSGWCVKMSNTNSRNAIYSRGTALHDLCISSGCSWKTVDFRRTWVCCCNRDYCNTAISTSKSTISLLLSTLLLILMVHKSL